jgi:hypothetical protein
MGFRQASILTVGYRLAAGDTLGGWLSGPGAGRPPSALKAVRRCGGLKATGRACSQPSAVSRCSTHSPQSAPLIVARNVIAWGAPFTTEAPMARNQREMEGDNEQRRAKAREARDAGKRPSEVGATLGASKQLKSAKRSASHQEKIDLEREGKPSPATSGKPRPGNREVDPKRTDRWR